MHVCIKEYDSSHHVCNSSKTFPDKPMSCVTSLDVQNRQFDIHSHFTQGFASCVEMRKKAVFQLFFHSLNNYSV